MVGDASLREIISADAVGAVATADQALARARFLGVLRLHLPVFEPRREHAEGLRLVTVLRAVVLAFHYQPGRQVGDAHRRIGFVDVLPARP